MKRLIKLLIPLLVVFWILPTQVFAQSASADEVVAKVREAAQMLSQKGDKALSQFNTKKSKWVWKDSYIWVLKCESYTAAAHAFSPKFVGRDNSDLVDKKGNYFFMQMCDDAERFQEKGSWIEYWWPKKGESQPVRKVAYTLQVKGTPYQVSAGIYSPSVSADELNAKLK